MPMSPRRKTVARGTWRTSADMLWLQELLCNIGLRPWVESLRKQGTAIRLRRSSLVNTSTNPPLSTPCSSASNFRSAGLQSRL